MGKAASSPVIDSLRQIGFSEMEAAVYCALLQRPGSTGYALAKALQRPHANVYQGLTGLEARGAVMIEAGRTKSYTAVPPAELLTRMRARFDAECAAAAAELSRLEVQPSADDHFYRLTSREQLIERARLLIAGAEATVLFQGQPLPVQALRDELEAAQARGVPVAGLVFREEDRIPGTRLILSRIAARVLERWPADQFNLVVDGSELLIGLLDPETGAALNGIWGRSTYIASIFHNALVSDTLLHDQPFIDAHPSGSQYLFGRQTPGFARSIDGARAAGSSEET